MNEFINRGLAEYRDEADHLRLLAAIALGRKEPLLERMRRVEALLERHIKLTGADKLAMLAMDAARDMAEPAYLPGVNGGFLDALGAVRRTIAAIRDGDAETAAEGGMRLANFLHEAGDPMRQLDVAAGRKSWEAAPTGARNRDRQTSDARNARWLDIAASKPTWTPNRTAKHIAEAEGAKLRTVRAVLYRERGAQK